MKIQKSIWVAVVAAAILSPVARAGQADTKKVIIKEEVPAGKGAPLPLHQIEGNGGVLTTLSAYIVNPPRNGEAVGRPALGAGFISLGSGRALVPATLTWSPHERIELGYGFDWYSIGSLSGAIHDATGISLGTTSVGLHNFNARFQLLKENEFNQKWLPAVTAGVHYKVNNGISQINKELGGALTSIGLGYNQGVDFTLYASKLLTFLPRPVLLNAGGRATRAAELGLLGFSDQYSIVFEGNVAIFLTDWLILAGEYRQQPNNYTTIPGVLNKSGDWWTVDLAWIVNKNLTIAGGYGHFGNVANEKANGVWGLTAKYEF
ncbi:MAG: DUF3034 family protein [Verrucomicrobiae bacterium]